MRLQDLSHTLHAGMPVFPGDPEVRLSGADAAPPWRVTGLELGSHSGTHIDAASHFVERGATSDTYPLERFVLECAVIHLQVNAGQALAWDDIAAGLPAEPAGRGVLLHTGWDQHWDGPQALEHPFLSEDAAQRLAAAGVGLVGTDALNVDATAEPTTGVHEALLGADVLVVENLTNLGELEGGKSYTCAFVPLKLAGCDGSPIRAYAWM
jgi:arylformamidase